MKCVGDPKVDPGEEEEEEEEEEEGASSLSDRNHLKRFTWWMKT